MAITATARTAILGGGTTAGSPTLVLSGEANTTLAGPGDTVTYTLTVLNAGTANATNVGQRSSRW